MINIQNKHGSALKNDTLRPLDFGRKISDTAPGIIKYRDVNK